MDVSLPIRSQHTSSSPHLSRESAVESEPDLGHETGKSLVEEVAEELADAEISPAAVDEQEALQVGELCQGVVAALHGLHALQPADAHPNVSSCGGRGRFLGSPLRCLVSQQVAPRLMDRGGIQKG